MEPQLSNSFAIMFTGIIEQTGVLLEVAPNGSGVDFWIDAGMAPELKPDQSVAHNGVCLTVVSVNGSKYRVTAVEETLAKTNLSDWEEGNLINLERALKLGDRLDGHFVQGHVDTTGKCLLVEEREGSHIMRFEFPAQFAPLMIEKGSICLDGVSVTVFDVTRDAFSVTIIPYTIEHTNLQDMRPGKRVNLEFDVLGKYLMRQQELSLNP